MFYVLGDLGVIASADDHTGDGAIESVILEDKSAWFGAKPPVGGSVKSVSQRGAIVKMYGSFWTPIRAVGFSKLTVIREEGLGNGFNLVRGLGVVCIPLDFKPDDNTINE